MIFFTELILGIILFLEYQQYKVMATPTIVLGGIYILLIPMVNTVGVSLGFYKLNDKTILLLSAFIFLVWISGLVWGIYYRQQKKEDLNFIGEKLLVKENKVWKMFFASLVCYIISLLQVISRYGINGTKSHAFGVFAHIGFISRCLLPIIIFYFIKTRSVKYLIGAIVNIIALIVFRGKYHLFIPIAGFFSLILIQNKNITIMRVIKILTVAFILALILFIAVYTIIPNFLTGERSWNAYSKGILFSTKHFFHYLFCPLITSNTYFDNPVYKSLPDGLMVNFNPLQRLFAFLNSSQYYSPVITLWPVIDQAGNRGNVGGIFSESVLNIGYPLSIIYIVAIASMIYYFLTKCLLNGKRIITTLCLFGTLMMSFFCNYFSLLPNFECFVYSYLIDLFVIDRDIVFVKKNRKYVGSKCR